MTPELKKQAVKYTIEGMKPIDGCYITFKHHDCSVSSYGDTYLQLTILIRLNTAWDITSYYKNSLLVFLYTFTTVLLSKYGSELTCFQ